MDSSQNIETCLKWRGLPFPVSPFSAIDAIVFCRLAYHDLASVKAAAGDAGVSLAGCFAKAGGAIVPKGPTGAGTGSFAQAARTARFGSIPVRHYVDARPRSDGAQFSAAEYLLPDGRTFAPFKGADSTLLGWKEDFELSFR